MCAGESTGMFLPLESPAAEAFAPVVDVTATPSVPPAASASESMQPSIEDSTTSSESASETASATSAVSAVQSARASRVPTLIDASPSRHPSAHAMLVTASESDAPRTKLRAGITPVATAKDDDEYVPGPSSSITTAAWVFVVGLFGAAVLGFAVYLRRRLRVPTVSPQPTATLRRPQARRRNE
jgi:hypothetical protein